MPELLIIGGGFAGLWAALVARRVALDIGRDLSIRVVSAEDHLTIRPRLYEPHPEAFRVALLPIFSAVDIDFIHASVATIAAGQRLVRLAGGAADLGYDRLVLATGSVSAELPVAGAETAFNLDSLPAAMAFKGHLKRVIPASDTPTIAILGAGFSGIEIALNMRAQIKANGDASRAGAARIILLERGSLVGAGLGPNAQPFIAAALQAGGIDVRLGASVQSLDRSGLKLEGGERIAADAVVVSCGLKANSLAEQFAGPRDSRGRLRVDPDLRLGDFPDVFAAGDVAHAVVDDAGHVAMMSCQHAMTMGRFAGHNAAQDILGLPTAPYRQERYVTCLDLGPEDAVFTTGWDRVVTKTGQEAKHSKRYINGTLIYPPGGDRDQILAAATLERNPASAPGTAQ